MLKLKCTNFDLGSADPSGGAYSAPPDALARFQGPTSKGKEGGNGSGRKGQGKGKGRESGRGEGGRHSLVRPLA